MYLPNVQTLLASALALSSVAHKDKSVVIKGKVLDYCNAECVDDDGNTHCTKPFLITNGTTYNFEWKTLGALTHTTLELREVKDNKNVHYYKDVDGEWDADKTGLVYLDFIPRTGCNNEVEYIVREVTKDDVADEIMEQ